MSTLLDAKGRTWVNQLQVGWTTFAEDRAVYRDAWRNLVARLEVLFPLVGLKLEPTELTWSRPPKQPKGAKWSAAKLRQVDAMLDAGELIAVGSTHKIADRPTYYRPDGVDIYANGFLADHGAHVSVSIDTLSLSAHEEDEIAEAFASWLPDVAESTEAVWGFVTSDPHWFPYIETPYEGYYRLPQHGRPHARKHPRGYYWANLLTSEHIEGLGGVDVVVERATKAGLVVGSTGKASRPSSLTVRIPSPITSYTDDELRAVKTLLDPVLLKGPLKDEKEPSRILVDQ
jgi:hypothetical protein